MILMIWNGAIVGPNHPFQGVSLEMMWDSHHGILTATVDPKSFRKPYHCLGGTWNENTMRRVICDQCKIVRTKMKKCKEGDQNSVIVAVCNRSGFGKTHISMEAPNWLNTTGFCIVHNHSQPEGWFWAHSTGCQSAPHPCHERVFSPRVFFCPRIRRSSSFSVSCWSLVTTSFCESDMRHWWCCNEHECVTQLNTPNKAAQIAMLALPNLAALFHDCSIAQMIQCLSSERIKLLMWCNWWVECLMFCHLEVTHICHIQNCIQLVNANAKLFSSTVSHTADAGNFTCHVQWRPHCAQNKIWVASCSFSHICWPLKCHVMCVVVKTNHELAVSCSTLQCPLALWGVATGHSHSMASHSSSSGSVNCACACDSACATDQLCMRYQIFVSSLTESAKAVKKPVTQSPWPCNFLECRCAFLSEIWQENRLKLIVWCENLLHCFNVRLIYATSLKVAHKMHSPNPYSPLQTWNHVSCVGAAHDDEDHNGGMRTLDSSISVWDGEDRPVAMHALIDSKTAVCPSVHQITPKSWVNSGFIREKKHTLSALALLLNESHIFMQDHS